jgi:hypothetical protein
MAAFSDPEVMAALQDGTFSIIVLFILTMTIFHFFLVILVFFFFCFFVYWIEQILLKTKEEMGYIDLISSLFKLYGVNSSLIH